MGHDISNNYMRHSYNFYGLKNTKIQTDIKEKFKEDR